MVDMFARVKQSLRLRYGTAEHALVLLFCCEDNAVVMKRNEARDDVGGLVADQCSDVSGGVLKSNFPVHGHWAHVHPMGRARSAITRAERLFAAPEGEEGIACHAAADVRVGSERTGTLLPSGRPVVARIVFD